VGGAYKVRAVRGLGVGLGVVEDRIKCVEAPGTSRLPCQSQGPQKPPTMEDHNCGSLGI
jgi:hypothetical protein